MNRSSVFALTLLVYSSASAISVDVQVWRHSYCGRESGYATASVSGGVPPYTYEWSNGSTDWQAIGLFPGNYSLTVTDSQMDQATADFTIDLHTSYDGLAAVAHYANCPGEPRMVVVFTGMEAGFQQPPPSSAFGPGPYSFWHDDLLQDIQTVSCWDGQDLLHNVLAFSPDANDYVIVDFADAAGCPGQMEVYLAPEWTSFPLVQPLNVTPSCASTATGSITISTPGNVFSDWLVKLRPDGSTDYCTAQGNLMNILTGAPSQTYTFTDLLPGDYWLVTSNDGLGMLVNTPYTSFICADSMLVTVPSLGTDCGVLSGRVFIDDDANCTAGGAENRVPATIVEIVPGPHYVTTSSNGLYSIGLNFGSYTITEQNPVFDQSCSGAVTLASASQTMNVGCAGGEPLDVQLAMANGPARPGFELLYAIDLDNLTPASTGMVTLTVTLDPLLGFISAYPAPSSVADNVLTWTAPQLVMDQVFQHRDINVHALVPPDVGLIGSTLVTSAQVATANTDGNAANNTAISNQLVTGSFDPNDKLASTSLGADGSWLINEDEWIHYTIRFQNTGTDTAFNVIITDTLPSTLDPSSVVWGAGSHAHSRALMGQGVLKFIFANILLPDSNANEPLSHGLVSFRIRPHLPIAPGTVIENTANIYFDFNDPVITEPSVLVAEFSTAIEDLATAGVRIFPNPASDRVTVAGEERITGIRLRGMDGRLLQQLVVNKQLVEVDMDGIGSGIYLLEVLLEGGNTINRSIIKH